MKLPSEAAMRGVWASFQTLLLVSGTVMEGLGIETSSHAYKLVEMSAGAILIVGPAIWGVITAVNGAFNQTDAVNAALNLVQSGEALAADGTKISFPAGVKLLPATAESAQAIVKNFSQKKTP